jgi:palmitoyltransferase ZDHHC9/14/18
MQGKANDIFHFPFAEKSNSIAHLVENEMPLSNSVGDITMDENLSKLNNLSGSYNNLFRENSVISTANTSNDLNEIAVCNDGNIYSNIGTNDMTLVKPSNNSKACNVADENHVYSNIQNSGPLVASTPKAKSAKISTSISANLLNELDLDDPVLTSSYKSAHKPPLPTVTPKEPKVYLNKNPQQIAAVDMKNIIKTLDVGTINAVVSAPANNTDPNHRLVGELGTNNAFISNLKHLQESTMIGTALDLDSLELDSIGNGSQSCLVKTAIV